MLTVGSLFSGIGCIDLGLCRAGLKLAWQCEIEADCRRVLERHWPAVPKFADVKDVGNHNLEQVDLIAFGSPCQGLSVAGKREGLADERSNLFFEAVRVVREMRPTFVLWENVPGSFSSYSGEPCPAGALEPGRVWETDEGSDFAVVLRAFLECGASDIAWRVLDGQYFGVAQRRRRVWLVADFGGTRAGEILFESDCRCGYPPTRGQAGQGTPRATAFRTSGNSGVMPQGDRTAALNCNTDQNQTIVATLNSGGNNGGFRTEPGEHLVVGSIQSHSKRHGHAMTTQQAAEEGHLIAAYSANGSGSERAGQPTLAASDDNGSNHLVAYNIIGLGQQGKNHAYEASVTGAIQHKGNSASGNEAGTVVAFQERGRDGGRTVESQEELAYSLNAPQGGGRRQEMNIVASMGVRRLMPIECLRLQGLPDDWLDVEPPLSDSAKYRMIGNGAVVPNVKWIGRQILNHLNQHKE